MKALVVGGTGPSGPYVIQDLLDRGHDVTILHRGVHEPPGLPDVRHIHADRHFAEPLQDALRGEKFDIVFGLYGRLEVLADVFAHRCEKFITVGGRPIYAGYLDPSGTYPRGMQLLTPEDGPLGDGAHIPDSKSKRFAVKMHAAEEAVMSRHRAGAYKATLFRYPYIYGPRALGSVEWSVIKRVQDGRTSVNLPMAGLVTNGRCSAVNAAHYLMLALDSDTAWGEIFNPADEVQYTLAQWVELIAGAMGAKLDIVDVPNALRWTVTNFLFYAGTVTDMALADISKAKRLLNYRDKVKPVDALADTVRWYQQNPLDWQADRNFPDKFDYALEDKVKAELEALTAKFEPMKPNLEAVHTYAHPKKPSVGGQVDEKGR